MKELFTKEGLKAFIKASNNHYTEVNMGTTTAYMPMCLGVDLDLEVSFTVSGGLSEPYGLDDAEPTIEDTIVITITQVAIGSEELDLLKEDLGRLEFSDNTIDYIKELYID